MENYQLRVVIEKAELDIKRNDLLQTLLKSVRGGVSIFPEPELRRLKNQSQAMEDYSQALGERIANFPDKAYFS